MTNIKYLILSLGALSLAACGDTAPQNTIPSPRPTKLFEVSSGGALQSVKFPAIIEAADESVLTFQTPGLLKSLISTKGADVKKGQVIGRLDPREFEANVASSQAEYDRAVQEHDRAVTLLKEDAIARNIVETRQSQRDTAAASLKLAKKHLSDTVLRAPFDGVIADVHINAFESISPQQPIVTLQSQGAAEAVVQVPASIVIVSEQIEPVNVELEIDAAPGTRIPAELSETVALAEPGTQTYEVRFNFTPPTGLLVLPGMTGTLSGDFTLIGEQENQNIEIPINTVLAEAGEPYVWIVDKSSMTVSKRLIKTRTGHSEKLVVTNGLKSGDVIVAAGGQYLFEGAEIRPYKN